MLASRATTISSKFPLFPHYTSAPHLLQKPPLSHICVFYLSADNVIIIIKLINLIIIITIDVFIVAILTILFVDWRGSSQAIGEA